MKTKTTNPIELFLHEQSLKKTEKASKSEITVVPIKDGDGIFKQIVAEENRFFIIAMILLIVGCLGGVAIALGAGGKTIRTALLVFPVMATLSLILAVQPMKYIVASTIIAVFIDISVIVFNLI